jgi:hypothetical protein
MRANHLLACTHLSVIDSGPGHLNAVRQSCRSLLACSGQTCDILGRATQLPMEDGSAVMRGRFRFGPQREGLCRRSQTGREIAALTGIRAEMNHLGEMAWPRHPPMMTSHNGIVIARIQHHNSDVIRPAPASKRTER